MSLDQNALDKLRIDRSAPPSSTRRPPPWRAWLIGAGSALLVAVIWWRSHPLPTVEVITVERRTAGDANAVLDASGYVVARRQATVASRVTGKVHSVLIEEGMQVREGQVLAQLDDAIVRRDLNLAREQLQATIAQRAQLTVRLDQAERAARRARPLRATQLISEADLDSADSLVADLRAQLAALAAQVKVSTAALAVQEQALQELTVRAPFAGVVVSKDAQPGEMVSPISAGGGFTRTGIATLVDMDSREIEVDVNEAFIHRVRDGQAAQATLDAYPEVTFASRVINIVPAADRQKATVKVRLSFAQLDARILPDMGVKVRFLDDQPAATAAPAGLLVPASCVVRSAAGSYVWRVRAERVSRVAVTVGATLNDLVALRTGVEVGDQLVLNPTPALRDGARVQLPP